MEIAIKETQAALTHKFVGDICGTFFVPRYQRGYRWETSDVEHLLNDIWDSKGKPYSLQPVVVKLVKRNEEMSSEWELIDGQQRLTTLYLIFLYMSRASLQSDIAPYSINYETRQDSETYLKKPVSTSHESNIDYFHIYKAYECISKWFDSHGQRRQYVANKFYEYLFDSVRVIWYEAPAELDSTALFTRLNVGRIPLTDAELVKALLLSGVRKNHAERAQELAAQWDAIERDLRHRDVWAFVAGTDSNSDSEKYPTRISLLLDTLADSIQPLKPGEKRPRYYTFDTLHKHIKEDSFQFWNQVIEQHALVLGWYEDPNLYNKIGFLVFTGTPFGSIVQLAKDQKKSDFEKLLIQQICCKIDVHASDLMGLNYENKKTYASLFHILLLMNVEAISRTGHHFPFSRHVGKVWSLEHIHAQNADNLTKVEQWKTWLREHAKALLALPDKHEELAHDIDKSLNSIDEKTFRNLAARVTVLFDAPDSNEHAAEHGLHSISNLALLSSGDNSALSNSVFEVKRQIVLEIDRNMDGKNHSYIPICTRNVFLKYYTDADGQQIHFWSPQDRNSYFKAIVSILAAYLKPEVKLIEASK